MTCAFPSISRAAAAAMLAALASLPVPATVAPLRAQAPPVPAPPVPPSSPLPAGSSPAAGALAPLLAPYRTPVIALVQPAANSPGGAGSVPQDRPVVVFRFAAGEPDDPLDLRSLLVAVDGVDRTALFQTAPVGASGQLFQAWGALADPATVARGAFADGPHRVTARVCSSRGACGSVDAQVLVSPAIAIATAPADSTAPGTKRRLLGAMVGAVRKLLVP